MEIFIFPELLYSLVLANIISPLLWEWRKDPWFQNISRQNPHRRIMRLKQYIMDQYQFNLDLETWGLTDQEKELGRFKDIIDPQVIKFSNALFGYEGDRYYFDINIRSHFGLDKYDSRVIPYWKTETLEAMNAFKHKPEYTTGAGECVSLSALYAAALFVVCRIPLEDIFLMATPLHSQNYIDAGEGYITNNRRIVTKNMWVNGSVLSDKARRALENEQVTLLSHLSGHIHTIYKEATIAPLSFQRFRKSLNKYLTHDLSPSLLGNFLRSASEFQKCFQFQWKIHGKKHYIEMEKIMRYEQEHPFQFTDGTRKKLMEQIDEDEFYSYKLPERMIINDLEDLIRTEKIRISDPSGSDKLKKQFAGNCLNAAKALDSLLRFSRITPRLPDITEKKINSRLPGLNIQATQTREEIIQQLESLRSQHPVADLTFYAYRDLRRTDSAPFLLAALKRNPVCIEAVHSFDINTIRQKIMDMGNRSIYPGLGRLAQPDEVWNFGTGDGLEKALLLGNILVHKIKPEKAVLTIQNTKAELMINREIQAEFSTKKGIKDSEWNLLL